LRAASIGSSSGPATNEDDLAPWHNPPTQFAERNLGLAYSLVGRRLDSTPFSRRGYDLLRASSNDFPEDPALLRAMGNSMTGFRDENSARALFSEALAAKPNSALLCYDMAFAAAQAGNTVGAIEFLEKTLQLDPLLVTPYKELARLYTASQQPALARQTYERFLKSFPDSIEAQKGMLRSAHPMHRQ
jgi:tetratricopeptide (TPR) repeat protein